MSEIRKRIETDFKIAMKAKDPSYPTLSFLRAAIKQVEVDTRKDLTDEDMAQLLTREVKKRRDAITDYEKGGRADLADKEKKEIEVLQKYMPAQMSDDEVKAVVAKVLAEMGPVDPSKMGQVVGKVMALVKGKTDGGTVSRLVKEALTKK